MTGCRCMSCRRARYQRLYAESAVAKVGGKRLRRKAAKQAAEYLAGLNREQRRAAARSVR